MGLEGAVRLGFKKELGAIADPVERQRLFEKLVRAAYQHGKALTSATTFELDDVIDPADSRAWITRLAPAERNSRVEVVRKTAIVTGGGGGIGGALATRLARDGARVVVADLDAKAAAEVAEQANSQRSGAAVGAGADVSDTAEIQRLIRLAENEFGPVDLYFANAGITGVAGLDVSETDWERSLDVNLLAHIRAAQLLVPGWVERGEGYFVSTASAAGLLTQLGSATYSVTKHAAVGFAEWLNITYGDKESG